MLDKLALKKKLAEMLMEHMDNSQGSDLHEMIMSKKKPDHLEKLEVEIDPLGDVEGMDKKDDEAEEKDELMAKAKKVSDGDEEMSDEEIEEMLKGLA